MPKISELPINSTIASADLLPVVHSGSTQQISLSRARGGFISLLDFIPQSEHAAIKARTSTYDCSTALANAIASESHVQSAIFVGGPTILVPHGKYYFASRIEIKKAITIKAEGSAHPYGSNYSEFNFAPSLGPAAITINAYNTINGGTEGVPTTAGSGTVIEGLFITGTLSGTTMHGVWFRGKGALEKCYIHGFTGNGINVVATAGGGGAVEGNANNFRVLDCATYNNNGHGMYVVGADVNAGIISALDSSNNQGWGIYDSGFLGNTYIACHTAGNVLGSYKTDNANGRNVLLNCYSESGQPTGNCISPTQIYGGLHGAGMTGSAPFYSSDTGGAVVNQVFQVPMLGVGYGQSSSAGDVLQFGDTQAFLPWTLTKALGRFGFQWGHINTPGGIMFYDKAATPGNGYPRDLSSANSPSGGFGAIGLDQHYFGSATSMKWRGLGTAAPVAGDYLQGDIIWNSVPAAGGFIGWVCTTAGNPGTWKTFGAISP